MKSTCLMVLIAFLTSCSMGSGKKPKWSKDEEKLFLQTCIAESQKGLAEDVAKGYCGCMMKKIQVEFPDAGDAGNLTMSESMEMAKDCFRILDSLQVTKDSIPSLTDSIQ